MCTRVPDVACGSEEITIVTFVNNVLEGIFCVY